MKSKIFAGIFIILSMAIFAEEEEMKMNEDLKKALLKLEVEALERSGHPLNEKTQFKGREDYFESYQSNLFEDMDVVHRKEYEDGDGGELYDTPAKMKSIFSSSAMTFNLLGNGEKGVIRVEKDNKKFVPGIYEINYEKKLLTLKRSNKPAHLDAVLQNGTNAIFCEMKMLEWMRDTPDSISDSYFNDERYYFKGDALEDFKKLRESLKEKMSTKKHFEHYDAWQMYKHILGIYNMSSDLTKEEIKLPKNGIPEFLPEFEKVVLANVIFEPPVDAFSDENVRKEYTELQKSEHDEFETFKRCVENSGIIEAFKKDCSFEFSVELLTAAQFMDCFDISDSHKNYLQRYRLDK